MTIKRSKIKIILAFMALFLIQFAVLAPVSADLTEVETNKQGLNKTEPTDGSGGEPVDGEDESLPWWKKALNELGDIGDGLIDGWNKFKDWAVDEWNDAWDTAVKFGKDVWGDIEDFFGAIGDWFSENKWVQTLLGGILAAVIIIGAIALLVFFGVIAIPIGIVGGLIILAGALIGGFLYQWLAGDNYSFWGAFGFSLVGGIVGYIGYATGAFAAAIGWLRTVAWPAVMTWWRTAAWPWLRGRPAAIWGWMRGTAWPWLRTKSIGAYNWARTNPILRKMGLGLKYGAITGAASSVISAPFAYWITGEGYSIKSFLIDTVAGGITGAILAPFIIPGAALGTAAILALGVYGGAENYIVSGFKDGEWMKWENFIIGFGVSVLSVKFLGDIIAASFKKVPILDNNLIIDTGTKSAEEGIKSFIKLGEQKIENLIENIQSNQGDMGDPSNSETDNEPMEDQNLDKKEVEQDSKEIQGNKNPAEQGTSGSGDATTGGESKPHTNPHVPSSGSQGPVNKAM
jgi:hypothetical protein